MKESDTLDNRYIIGRRIGRGGTADVYHATDRMLNREVAVKVLHESLSADPLLMTRIHAEVRICRELEHAGIVEIYDFRPDSTPPYIVMEYMSGGDLRKRLFDVGTLPTGEVRRIAGAITAALAEAHRRGIVHRDIKPRNILFSEDGSPKIADFGLAQSATALYRTDSAGTPEYTAPETVTARLFDARSDLYALGCTLYEALIGRPPFSANTPAEVVRGHLEREPSPLSAAITESDASLASLVMRMLAKDPNDRPQTTGEALAWLSSTGSPPPPVTGAGRCPSCGGPVDTGYPWCVRCGKALLPAVRQRRGATILVTGPGRSGEKLAPELRDAASDVCDEAALDTSSLRRTIPRVPFLLARSIDPAAAQRISRDLGRVGVTAEVIGAGSGRRLLRGVFRKSLVMSPRIYVVILGMTGGLFQSVMRLPPAAIPVALGLVLAGVPVALSIVYARSQTKAGPQEGALAPNVVTLLASTTDSQIHARMHSIAATGAAIRSAAARSGLPESEQERLDAGITAVLDRAAGLCLALEQAKSGARYLDSSHDDRQVVTAQSVEERRGFERIYTRTLELLGRSALKLRELSLAAAGASVAQAARSAAEISAVAERLADESEALSEVGDTPHP